MKIVNNRNERYPDILYNAKPGQCVEFERTFHQKHAANAKFLVLRVPTEYIKIEARHKDGEWRIMVANIETGAASLITTERRIRIVKAEVVLS